MAVQRDVFSYMGSFNLAPVVVWFVRGHTHWGHFNVYNGWRHLGQRLRERQRTMHYFWCLALHQRVWFKSVTR